MSMVCVRMIKKILDQLDSNCPEDWNAKRYSDPIRELCDGIDREVGEMRNHHVELEVEIFNMSQTYFDLQSQLSAASARITAYAVTIRPYLWREGLWVC